ncbi:anhydro-N-acetylmuramic acid kinase [Gallibacterium salpingitidis]|uniref:Anhydro-N-acetylmuramic acid kinase n=1 Tax=Gallibacterium salpingitidis TaxID=505341 RepID=A0A1A7NSL3_9PAST|nr:anhydro-N-acetylmuramic acid kinase [Gallibacterium salpingitidis]OBW91979.1 anhydro-N-acetylmuramic acid kinase [Gallibacterium salpingitidis]OBX04983.1 anhydro-N-acetylmuramic acid kinase [Gallibacterium salpingitidis]
MQSTLYIGMMSGTSLDGIDIAVVDFSVMPPKIVAKQFTAMPEQLRQQLAQLMQGQTTLQQLGEIEQQLTLLYAEQVNAILDTHQIPATQIQAIGCHGQTIWHAPQGNYPFTMQLVDGNLLSARTGITSITDFRRKDMAYGGQGAPLVPAFHHALFSKPDSFTVVLNIGGISNITVLPPDGSIYGYDTGPGNTLLDNWIQRQQGKRFDNNGEWASQGSINQALLTHCLNEAYFSQQPPKSTGRELFNLTWLDTKLALLPAIKPADVQATLLELTAQSISQQLPEITSDLTYQLLVCGGGARNQLLMQRLQKLLPQWQVLTTNHYGIDIDFVEAAAFAWLAYQTMQHKPSNVPAVTGASQPAILGAIHLADIF